jgi:hypothetical protein
VTAAVETPTRPPAADSARALLPYEPQSVAAARRLVRTALPGWELDDLVEAGELIVSELVGNAAKTGCQLTMTVTVERITDRCVRISVRDGSRVLPCLIDAGPAAESGRGLALVHHLTGGHWGATPESYGKTVHADLCAPAPPQPADPPLPQPAAHSLDPQSAPTRARGCACSTPPGTYTPTDLGIRMARPFGRPTVHTPPDPTPIGRSLPVPVPSFRIRCGLCGKPIALADDVWALHAEWQRRYLAMRSVPACHDCALRKAA